MRFVVPLFVIVSVFQAWCAPIKLQMLKVGSTTYTNVTILSANATDAYISHSGGFANVKLRNLDKNLQEKLHYNPTAAQEAEKRQLTNDNLYLGAVSAQLIPSNRESGSAATYRGMFEDPLSENSRVGKLVPSLATVAWDGPIPEQKGRFAVLCFLSFGSQASQAALPRLQALHKAFSGQVLFMSVSVGKGPVARLSLESPSALDPDLKLSESFGITEVPAVALIAPEGTLLYQGHPAALDEKGLRQLLAPTPGEPAR